MGLVCGFPGVRYRTLSCRPIIGAESSQDDAARYRAIGVAPKSGASRRTRRTRQEAGLAVLVE